MPLLHKKVTTTEVLPFSYLDCWAKTREDLAPGTSVLEHSLIVGAVAVEIVRRWPQLAAILAGLPIGFISACHDIGKISPGFLQKCLLWLERYELLPRQGAWKACETDHGMTSQVVLEPLLGPQVARILGAHHGKPKQGTLHGDIGGAPWDAERRKLIEKLASTFGAEILPIQLRANQEQILAGLVTLADWIGSGEFSQDTQWDMKSVSLRACQVVDKLALFPLQFCPGCSFEGAFEFNPRGIQQLVLEAPALPGLYIIEEEMGRGKTEAALWLAYRLIQEGRASGLYFALPTQMSSNSIHTRVDEFLRRVSAEHRRAALVHGNAWLQRPKLDFSASDPDAIAWFTGKRALLSPAGVGTVDQALMGILAVKHFFLRQYALANKVVILDEVHSYDTYTSGLIMELVRTLRELGSTVIILSATLTRAACDKLLSAWQGTETKVSDSSYPRLLQATSSGTVASSYSSPTRKTLQIQREVATSGAPAAIQQAREGNCVILYCNTVASAQASFELARRLARGDSGLEVGLLHSRFPLFQRLQREAEWISRLGKVTTKRPERCVLVSTQVGEQSIDISGDGEVTEICPGDILLQRNGRNRRHPIPGKEGPAPVTLIIPPAWQLRDGTQDDAVEMFGDMASVYEPYVLQATMSVLAGRETLTLPQDIRSFIEEIYGRDWPFPLMKAAMEEHKRDMDLLARTATNQGWDCHDDTEGKLTRYEKFPQAELVLFTSWDGEQGEVLSGETVAVTQTFDFRVAKLLHLNSTRIPTYAAGERVKLIYFGDPVAIGVVQPNGRILIGNKGSGLCYDPSLGVVIPRMELKRRRSSPE